MRYIILFILLPFLGSAQSVDVMNYNNGQKATVPTTASSQLLPLSGTTNSVQMWNGSTWVNTGVSGITFQGLTNYWTKTGNNLSYTLGNVTIGALNNHRIFEHNGLFTIPFQSDTVPTSMGVGLSFGNFIRYVTNSSGNFIYNVSASTSAATLNLPISTLILQGRSNSDVFSNIAFVTGLTPTVKGHFTSTDFRLPYLAGNQRRFALLGVSDEVIDGPQLSGVTPSTGQVLMFNSAEYVPTTSGGDVSGAYSNLQIVADAVTATEISTGAVGTSEIADASILFDDIAQNGATTNQVIAWNGTGWVSSALSGLISAVTGTGANGQVAYWTGTSTQSGSNNLFWDAVNFRLGINTASPSRTFHVAGEVRISDLNTDTPTRIVGADPDGDLAEFTATTGQVLQYNGTAWVATTMTTKAMQEESFTATAGQTNFTIAYSAPAVSGTSVPVRVYRNGVRLFWVASAPTSTQFTYSGTTVTTSANVAGDIITIEYLN